ncbi:MAG TPA: hypothetical protein VL961_11510, partial [Acidimicrobiales bacterium]|nr:hypothetical protein [Acidimicrobiales bacterium]
DPWPSLAPRPDGSRPPDGGWPARFRVGARVCPAVAFPAVQLTLCPYCGDRIEHHRTERVRFSSDGPRRGRVLVDGAVLHECGDLAAGVS